MCILSDLLTEFASVPSVSNILDRITIIQRDMKLVDVSDKIRFSLVPTFPDMKFKLDISKFASDMKVITFSFKEDVNMNLDLDFEIILEEKTTYCSRPLYKSLVGQKGDKIKSPEFDVENSYFVNIHQDIYDAEDMTKKCINYPNKNYENYSECEKNFMRDSLDNLGLQNFIPFWATDDLSLVTEEKLLMWDDPLKYNLLSIFSGLASSKCKLSCTRTSSTVHAVGKEFINGSMAVTIVFPEEITIEKTELIPLNILTSLAFLGSNMGLWLGFGILQIIELFSGAITAFSLKSKLWRK